MQKVFAYVLYYKMNIVMEPPPLVGELAAALKDLVHQQSNFSSY